MTLGRWGEEVACRYLKRKGYQIIDQNFQCRLGEIDIIARDGLQLVFVEVKTRQNQTYGLPCEAVNKVKIRHLKRTAAYFAVLHSQEETESRIDVIEILKKDGHAFLHHIENITL